MIRRSDQGAPLGQETGDVMQLVERIDLPCHVIHAHDAPARRGRSGLGPYLEQPKIVVIGGPRSLHEVCLAASSLVDGAEAEEITIELGRLPGIPHIQNDVIETVDGHGGPPRGAFGATGTSPARRPRPCT